MWSVCVIPSGSMKCLHEATAGRRLEEQVLDPWTHARQAAQARELVLQAVLSLDPAHEDAVLLLLVVRFLAIVALRFFYQAVEKNAFPRESGFSTVPNLG